MMGKELALQLAKLVLPTGDGVVCGVSIEPWGVLRRGDQSVAVEDVPEEGAPEGAYQLRMRWYR